jgi:Domain of unknown function (DUF3303)
MLYGMIYTPRNSHEAAASSMQIFKDWQPPVEFRGHWNFATGGGMGLIEAPTTAALFGAIAPFSAFFEFKLEQLDRTDEEPQTSVSPELMLDHAETDGNQLL